MTMFHNPVSLKTSSRQTGKEIKKAFKKQEQMRMSKIEKHEAQIAKIKKQREEAIKDIEDRYTTHTWRLEELKMSAGHEDLDYLNKRLSQLPDEKMAEIKAIEKQA